MTEVLLRDLVSIPAEVRAGDFVLALWPRGFRAALGTEIA